MGLGLAAVLAAAVASALLGFDPGIGRGPDAGAGPGDADLPVATSPGAHPAPAAAGAGRPNIVVITSDDQSLSDLRWMPRTRRVLGAAGVTMTSMLSPHPLCCPARANLLTGQHAQNSGVRSNRAGLLGGFTRLDAAHTLATWLQSAGYRTAFVGKYLNGYQPYLDRIGEELGGGQPGWLRWNPIVSDNAYFGATFYNNGAPRSFRSTHTSDVIRSYTNRYIRGFASDATPFFIWAAHYAPHAICIGTPGPACWRPPRPAHRHATLFASARSPSLRDPAFNERNVGDKPSRLRSRALLPVRRVQALFLGRIRSLQAVDQAVAKSVATLRRVGELDNTVILFTSDNGMLLGEHRMFNKNLPYKQALRVPLLVRGPGIPHGQTRRQTVTMIDLAPTILELADATEDVTIDGRSLVPVLRSARAPGDGTVLIQSGPRTVAERDTWGWSWRGVRTGRYTYARYASGFEELYDRRTDRAELRNVAGRRAYAPVLSELRRRTGILGACAGADCRQRWGPVPRPDLPRP